MVELGRYKSREEEVRVDFEFSRGEDRYAGKKARFYFEDNTGIKYDSYVYLFISKDKFIKFRTSFNAEETPDWSGDEIVRTLLPSIEVPDESPYMSRMREMHRQEMVNQLKKLILEAVSEKESAGQK